MSQVSHPTIQIRSQLQAHRVAWFAALLALVATAAVVLIIAIDNGSSTDTSVAGQSQPALRADGGPDESAVAGAVGSRSGAGSGSTARPDESSVAAAVANSPTQSAARPDESATAAAISGR